MNNWPGVVPFATLYFLSGEITGYTHTTAVQQRDRMLSGKSYKRAYKMNEDIPTYM